MASSQALYPYFCGDRRLSLLRLIHWAQGAFCPVPTVWGRAYTLSLYVLEHFLSRDWVMEHVIDSKAPTRFFRSGATTLDDDRTHRFRVTALAEMLFNLQWIEGFDHCREKLSTAKDTHLLEGFIAELEVGKLLLLNSVPFRFIVAQGKLGQDYDFEIDLPDGRIAFADAKCKLESNDFSKNSIRNTLNGTRKQLPAGNTGVIFVKIPQHWVEAAEIADGLPMIHTKQQDGALAYEAVQEFLRNTSRVMSVILYSSIFYSYPKGARRPIYIWEVMNENGLDTPPNRMLPGPFSVNDPLIWVDFLTTVAPHPLYHNGKLLGVKV
jgi:hypothetical protein